MIFVTGGTGLVGAHILLDLASKNKAIKALKRESSSIAITEKIFKYYNKQNLLQNIKWVEGDLLDSHSLYSLLKDCKLVYHAAAFVSFHPKEIKKMMNINIKGTENIVNACLENKIEKLAYISSISTLSKPKNNSIINEKSFWTNNNNKTKYAQSKYFAEQEVWRGIQEGLDTVIVNPSVILGPGDWTKGSSQLFTKVWKGLKYYTPGATAFVDVLDVASIVTKLMESDMKNDRFILSSENMPYKQLFKEIAHHLGKKEATIKVTPFLKELAWRTEHLKYLISGIKPLLTKETANQAMTISNYSNQKICDLGYTFLPVSDSIEKYSNWFLKETTNSL
jgi:nucleoside-diphosphate-sugar epimerase